MRLLFFRHGDPDYTIDGLTEKVRAAGYEVFIEPADMEIPAVPPVLLRRSFCYGPLGEEIELFAER